jgi:uncharacterized protein (TIGR03067 family)
MLATVACLVAALLPAELSGAWELVSVEVEGQSVDHSDHPARLVFDGDRLLYAGKEAARLTADAETTPKVIDLRFSQPDRTLEGIYAIEGQTLKVCLSTLTGGARERPQDFATADHADRRLLVFRRAAEGGAAGVRGFVGLMIGKGEDGSGVAVIDTLDRSPAKAAGLKKGDVVLRVGGREVSELPATVELVRQAKPGDELAFHIRRDGAERDVMVKVVTLPFGVLAMLEV